jgi:hypothetical protein
MNSIAPKRQIQRYLFLFFSIIIFNTTQAQIVQLPREWKFKLGDNMDWANQSYSDGDWGYKRVGRAFAAKGITDNVYAWYRIKIVIPSGMKSAVEKGKGIKLSLGVIAHFDQTFFNGKLIGQTGSLPPDYKKDWATKRVYSVPEKEILWDKENVIAVRVFSLDSDELGMFDGPYNYRPIQWSDFITMQQTISETANNGFTTKIKFTNKSGNAFNGTVKYWIADKTNKELFTETKPVQVNPEPGAETVVTFSNYHPTNEAIFKVGCQVTDDNNTATIKNEEVHLANKEVVFKVANEPKAVVENKIQDVFTSIPFQNQQLQGILVNA